MYYYYHTRKNTRRVTLITYNLCFRKYQSCLPSRQLSLFLASLCTRPRQILALVLWRVRHMVVNLLRIPEFKLEVEHLGGNSEMITLRKEFWSRDTSSVDDWACLVVPAGTSAWLFSDPCPLADSGEGDRYNFQLILSAKRHRVHRKTRRGRRPPILRSPFHDRESVSGGAARGFLWNDARLLASSASQICLDILWRERSGISSLVGRKWLPLFAVFQAWNLLPSLRIWDERKRPSAAPRCEEPRQAPVFLLMLWVASVSCVDVVFLSAIARRDFPCTPTDRLFHETRQSFHFLFSSAPRWLLVTSPLSTVTGHVSAAVRPSLDFADWHSTSSCENQAAQRRDRTVLENHLDCYEWSPCWSHQRNAGASWRYFED